MLQNAANPRKPLHVGTLIFQLWWSFAFLFATRRSTRSSSGCSNQSNATHGLPLSRLPADDMKRHHSPLRNAQAECRGRGKGPAWYQWPRLVAVDAVGFRSTFGAEGLEEVETTEEFCCQDAAAEARERRASNAHHPWHVKLGLRELLRVAGGEGAVMPTVTPQKPSGACAYHKIGDKPSSSLMAQVSVATACVGVLSLAYHRGIS